MNDKRSEIKNKMSQMKLIYRQKWHNQVHEDGLNWGDDCRDHKKTLDWKLGTEPDKWGKSSAPLSYYTLPTTEKW